MGASNWCGVLCRQAEKAAEIARDKYDEAKGQRELAEQKTAEHKRTEAEHLTIQQRLHDAGAQLASISTEVEQQVSALSETQAARQQQSGRLQEAEAEVERIARELAEAQAVADQLRQDADAIMVSYASHHGHLWFRPELGCVKATQSALHLACCCVPCLSLKSQLAASA